MAGFLDVLLRGAMLTGGSLALGGVVFVLAALRASDRGARDGSTARALRVIAAGGGIVALGQSAIVALTLAAIGMGAAALPLFAATPFAWGSAIRVGLALVVVVTASRLTRTAQSAGGWPVLALSSALLVASSALISHAAARVDHRPVLIVLDGVHQVAAAIWVGGLAHLVTWRHRAAGGTHEAMVLRRFSTVAAFCVLVLVAAGIALSAIYVGDVAALVETAYGVMILTKAVLLLAILVLAAANYRLIRQAAGAAGARRLARFVEVEIGLAVTVLFAAASLTSVPPAVDVRDDRATVREVVARFTAMPPRLASPDVDELLRQTNPLAGGPERRLEIERQWSEFNHHWAGIFVLAMGLAAIAHGAGARVARHWPLLMVVLALALVVRTDPEVWPLGPVGFWESFAQPEIAQHRLFMVLVMLFGAFEWAVRTDRLPTRPWGYVFPVICAIGGGLLLTHSHTVFGVKEAFLMEVTHAPIGVLGAFAGWARWLELRLPEIGPLPGQVWRGCLVVVGLVLLFYSEG